MMKKSMLLLVLVKMPVFGLCGQGFIQGNVTSGAIHEPVRYAHVYVRDLTSASYVGTVTDSSGSFVLQIPVWNTSDSITISCIGYESLKLPIDSVRENGVIRLNESTTQLASITIYDLSAEEFMRNCIKVIDKNYHGVAFFDRGVYWQLLRTDSVYKRLERSSITLQSKYYQDKTSRSIHYDSSVVLGTLSSVVIDSYDSLNEILYFDLIRTGPGILNLKYSSEWNYSYGYSEDMWERGVVVIKAINKGRFRNDYTFYVDSQDLAFRRIEFEYNWPELEEKASPFPLRSDLSLHQLDTIKTKLVRVSGVALYEKTLAKYNLKYLFGEIRYNQFVRNSDFRVLSYSNVVCAELMVHTSSEYRLGHSFKGREDKFPMDTSLLNPKSTEFLKALKSLSEN